MSKHGPVIEQFFEKVLISKGCWEWTGSKLYAGYGAFKAGRAHRVSWELSYGKIPNGLSILHRCDNRKCVRPTHLYAGTQAQNMIDRSIRGRVTTAKLSPNMVRAIRPFRGNLSSVVVARLFGVSKWVVRDVWLGKTYRHIGG